MKKFGLQLRSLFCRKIVRNSVEKKRIVFRTNKEIKAINDAISWIAEARNINTPETLERALNVGTEIMHNLPEENWQHFKHLAANIIRDRQEFLWARDY